jgi:hypothetical protein
MQLMRRFARSWTTIYINSIVMQNPKVSQGKKFLQKLARKAKSIFTGLKKTDAGFWAYSPFTLPAHHLDCARGKEAKAIKREAGFKARRWVVERTHSWMNRFRRILIRWEKKPEIFLGLVHFVCVIITFRCSGLFG